MYGSSVYGCLVCMYGYEPLVYLVPEEAKMVVSCHVGTENETWALGRATDALNCGGLSSLFKLYWIVCF